MSDAHPGLETDDALEVRAVAAERLTFFADAVIAIAITLLALELYVPQGDTNAAVWHDAARHSEDYLAFVISFIVVGAHWRAHHTVFRFVTSLGGRLAQFTLYWLLMQVITPFATKVLTADGAFESRFAFYAVVQAAAGVLFLLMVLQARRHELLRPDTPRHVIDDALRRSAVLAAGFLVSIPLSLAIGRWAYLCWAVVPLGSQLIGRLVRRGRPVDHRG